MSFHCPKKRVWELYGTVGSYAVWKANGGIYQMTKDGQVPSEDDGGYYDLEWLVRMKGHRVEEINTEF